MTSSIRDLIFGEEITLFEALDQLEVTSLYSQIDELTIRVDLLDSNLRSLATTVDTNHRQTQLQIQDLTTSVVQMQTDVLIALNRSTTALTSASEALSTANEAIRISNLVQSQFNDLLNEVTLLRVEIPRFLRGGMSIIGYRERDGNTSETISIIFPSNVNYVMSHTQYLTASRDNPTSFFRPVTLAGFDDNSRNNITLTGPRYRIREGPVKYTATGALSVPLFLVIQ